MSLTSKQGILLLVMTSIKQDQYFWTNSLFHKELNVNRSPPQFFSKVINVNCYYTIGLKLEREKEGKKSELNLKLFLGGK